MLADSTVIHVLDDDPSMRRSLVRLLRACGWDARAYDSVSGFKATTAATDRGCLLLDVRLGDGSGLDLLEELAQDDSPLAIVLISGYGDVPSTVRAMRSGAVDVLTKPPDVARLQEAVTRADALSRQQFARKQEAGHRRELYDRLTPREREVCALVARGLAEQADRRRARCERKDGQGASRPGDDETRSRIRRRTGAARRSRRYTATGKGKPTRPAADARTHSAHACGFISQHLVCKRCGTRRVVR